MPALVKRTPVCIWIAAAVLLWAFHAGAWEIQTGTFIASDPWVATPSIGVTLVSDTQISVDRDGDNVNEATYDLPAEIRPDTDVSPAYHVEYRLSPTREILYTWRYPASAAGPAVCGTDPDDVEVFFHRLDEPPGTGMTSLMAGLPSGSACMPNGVDIAPRFYDKHVYDPIRTAVVVSGPTGGTGQYHTVLWVDLADGGAYMEASFYEDVLDEVEFAPSGNAALIRHGYSSTTGLYDTYTLIDLCDSPLGDVTVSRAHPPDATSARVDSVTTNVDIRVEATGYSEAFLLDASCASGTPTLHSLTATAFGLGYVVSNSPVTGGINCSPVGGDCEEVYPDGQTVDLEAIPLTYMGTSWIFTGWGGDCSGTSPTTQVLMDGDKTCSAAFALPLLSVSISSPTAATIPRESTIEYVLTYQNGGVAVSNVVIQDTLPAGVFFVSASNGGTESGGVVTWNLGSVPAGTTDQVTLTVGTDCSTPQPIRNDSFFISSTQTGVKSGTTSVETSFDAAITDPVTVTVASTPASLPLRSGDVIPHDITLTNTGAQAHHCLKISLFPGEFTDFGTLTNSGGGTMDMLGPDSWTWTGSLDAAGTTTISFTTLVEDCIWGSAPETRLNGSFPIRVRNVDGTEVGSGMAPGPFPIQQPVTISYSALNLGPPQHYQEKDFQAARAGDVIDFQIVLTNGFPENQPSVSIEVPIPQGFTPVGNPPFIPPTDPGAVFDSLNQTVAWSGPIPGNTSVTITYQAQLAPDAACREENPVTGSTGTCPNLQSSLVVLKVPDLPEVSYLTGLDGLNGLYTWRPGVDQGFQELFCLPVEFAFGISRSQAGDYWVAGSPTFHFNPETLDFIIHDSVLYPLFAPYSVISDVDVDDGSGSVVFLGSWNDAGTYKSAVKRYDPGTGTLTDIIDDLPDLGRIIVDRDGWIAGLEQWHLHRIDPADPLNYLTFGPSGLTYFSKYMLTLDTDGNYLVPAVAYWGSATTGEPVLKMDLPTPPFYEIVPDLAAVMQTPYFSFASLAVGPAGELFFGMSDGSDVAEVVRGTMAQGTFLSGAGTVPVQSSPGVIMETLVDLVYTDKCPELHDADGDVDGLDLSTFAQEVQAATATLPVPAVARFFGRTDCP